MNTQGQYGRVVNPGPYESGIPADLDLR